MAKTLQRKFMFASMLAVTILLVTLVGAINIMNCCAVINRQKVMLEMLCERDGRPEGPGRLREMDAEKDGTEQSPFFGTEDSTGDGHMSPDSGRQQEGMSEKSRTVKHGLFQRAMTMDEALAIRFFAVWYDEEGKIILTDCSHIYAVTEEGAREMAQSILSLGKSTGVYQGFRYMYMDRDSFASGSREQDIQTGTGQEEAAGVLSAAGSTAAAQTELSSGLKNGASGILVAMDISADRGNMLQILGISALIAALCWLAMLLPVHTLAKRAIAPTAMSIERQKQFVTDAGHELKTPLAIIQANTEALELFNGESKWTRNIKTQTVRLNGLMQNLLTLSRMDELSLQLEKKPFSLNTLVCEVWENFAEPAAGRKLTAQILGDDGREYRVLANRDTIAQLLSILFDNAVKYTPRGGRIEVNIRSGADGVRLIQSNTVSEEEESSVLTEDPDRLFERFYRTDSDRSRRKGGYGIGLSAARAIVGANNGSIKAAFGDGRIIFTVFLKEDRT